MSLSQREVLYTLLQGKQISIHLDNAKDVYKIVKINSDGKLAARHPFEDTWSIAGHLMLGYYGKTITYQIYTEPPKTYSFLEAWQKLNEGHKIARIAWQASNGKSNYLQIKDSKVHLFFYVCTAPSITTGISLNDKDLNATDWIIYEC
jgi:hypothetical protein